jgi:hypothetical protein
MHPKEQKFFNYLIDTALPATCINTQDIQVYMTLTHIPDETFNSLSIFLH